ncbi:MAG: tRNA (adenosine(37)-N6)-threonylcarbamoyltransferase complex ATPase subunit type 1 TsaE [Planctomycetota bacterium]
MSDALAVHELSSAGPDQTADIGAIVGRCLRPGDFVGLDGPLGAGKTQFVKGVAAGLAVPADEPVVSPTFVLVREYAGRLKLYHLDAYRLTAADELRELGLDEMLAEPGAVVALEWADRVEAVVPPRALRVELEHAGEWQRRLRLRWSFGRLAEVRAALGAG